MQPPHAPPSFDSSEPTTNPQVSLTPVALRGWRERFRAEHLGLVLTLSYVFLAAVGMLHEAIVFALFRINIIEYAEPSDFILAALRDPLVVLVNLAAIPVVGLYYRWIIRVHMKTATARKWWMGPVAWRVFTMRYVHAFFVFTLTLYAFTGSLMYASHTAKQFRAGLGPRVHVELIADPAHIGSDTASLLLLGTTQKFFFLYDATKRVTSVVPTNNVARVIVAARKPVTSAAAMPVSPSTTTTVP